MQLLGICKSLTVVLLSIFIMACGGGYTIVQPEENAEFLNGLPEQFVIQYEKLPPRSITLNGVDVIDYFSFNNSQATASGDLLDGYLLEGNNILSVGAGLGPKRNFFYDSQGPSIVNHEVKMLPGNQVYIKGTLSDPSAAKGPMSLALNNQNIQVDGNGQFEATINKSSRYSFNTVDGIGHTANVTYADRGTLVDDMVAFEVTESAINDFLPVFQEIIEEVDLSQSEPIVLFREYIGINVGKKCAPIINFPCIGPINFDILEAEVAITGGKVEELTFENIDLKSGSLPFRGPWNGFAFDVEAQNGYLEGQAKLDLLGLSNNITTLLSWFGLADKLSFLAGIYKIGLPIDRFHVAATLAIEANDGKLEADLISLDDLGMGPWDAGDLDLVVPDVIKSFPFGLLEAILNTVFNGLEGARDIILDIIGKVIVPTVGNIFIDLFLNEVPQVHVGVGFDNGALFSALLATDRISIRVAESGISDNDRLLVSMNGRVGAEASGETPNTGLGLGQPAESWLDDYFNRHFFPDGGHIPSELGPNPGIAPQALGFRFTETQLPDPSSDAELAVNLSANLINQAMLAAYEAGLTTLSVPLKAEGQSVVITEPENANALLNFEPSVPAQAVFRGNRNAVAYLKVTNFKVAYVLLNAQGEWETKFQMVISADVPVQFSVEGDNGLNIALISPALEISFGADEGSLEEIILQQGFLQVLIKQVNTALSKIQLPEDIQVKVDNAGIEINPGAISLIGQPKEHISFESNFRAL